MHQAVLTRRPADTSLRRLFARPQTLLLLALAVLVVAAWMALGLIVGRMAESHAAFVDAGRAAFGDGTIQQAIWRVAEIICGPARDSASGGIADFALVLAMWCAMTLAMMVPTAGGMIFTYAEIADTAAVKGERIVSPLVLTAGYVVVWLGFALAASMLQYALNWAPLSRPTSMILSAALFFGAGAFQFSALKHACLRRCQRPFPFFFANWTTRPRGVFRLGLRQGMTCLGCCWATMLLMLAVGSMNVIWMAALGIIMSIEKLGTGSRFSKTVGLAFIAIGLGLAGYSVVTQ